MGETILVLGGTRSGKTRLAGRLADERRPVTYLATATVDPADPEMVARIDRHRAERPAEWSTREVPRDLEGALLGLAESEGSIVVDCLTLWLTNVMIGLGGGEAESDESILKAVDRVSAVSASGRARVIWVSNEVGAGIVPVDPLARRFADLQGWTNQRLAVSADAVHFCVAGLSIRLK